MGFSVQEFQNLGFYQFLSVYTKFNPKQIWISINFLQHFNTSTQFIPISFNTSSLGSRFIHPSDHLASLKSTVDSLQKSQSHHGLKSFLGRRISIYEISRIAGSIELEIQAWIDRESIEHLGRLLNRSPPISSSVVQSLVGMLFGFVERISQGFNRELQDLDCEDLGIRVMAMNCVPEIGYYGRKEAIDAMLEADLTLLWAGFVNGERGKGRGL